MPRHEYPNQSILIAPQSETHLVITSNKMLSTSSFIEHWIHCDCFDWSIKIDNLVVLGIVKSIYDHLNE